MNDKHGRRIDYIRLSVTDKCQLKCKYCVSEAKKQLIEDSRAPDFEQVLLIVKSFAKLGIKKVKITGGEPLLYPKLIDLIKQIKVIDNISEVTITTNGVLLSNMIDNLVSVGIDGINVSLDTLDIAKYQLMTKQDKLNDVLVGISKAINYKVKIKINCVLIAEINKDEVVEIAKLAKDNNIHVRFIEYMPMLNDQDFSSVSETWVKEQLAKNYAKLQPSANKLGNGPATYYQIDGFTGKIGFISAVSNHFCDTCNRVRITSDGYLKSCLYYNKCVDLKEAINNNNLEPTITAALNNKPKAHRFNDNQVDDKETKSMVLIGG